jgi:glycosyltransferase involved in cell wall biosynthesis
LISISHPQTQHSRKLAEALADAKLLNKFYTSLFYNPDRLMYLPAVFRQQISKGFSSNIPSNLINNFWLFEIFWRFSSLLVSKNFSNKLNYYNMWGFDSVIANKIKRDDCRVFIGFENASYNSFKSAKRLNKICVLDAASVHYKHQMKYYKPDFPNALIEKINFRKEKEIEYADYIVTLSSFAASTYKEFSPNKKIISIPLGVDTSKFKYKEKNISKQDFNFLFVGNITYAKGIDILVDAFHQIPNRNLQLTIAGAEGDAFELLSRDGRIVYVGKINHIELNRFYQQSDVLILPSRLDGFGMVVTEAMATGTPVIVSTHTGVKDLIKHNYNGWIFPDGQVEELKNAMLNVYENRKQLNDYGKAAAETVKEFTWDKYKKNIQEFYSTLLSEIN